MILHQGVGLHDIGADLAAPADFLDLAADVGELFGILLLLQKVQLGLQHLHGLVFVLELGALVLALHHDACRKVRDTDSRGSLVDMLAARAAGAVGVDAQILIPDLDVDIVVDLRHHVQRHEGGLPLALGVERGDADQTVHALLRFQIAVGVLSVHLEGHGFDACLVAVQIIQDLHGKALVLGPAGVHPVQHTGPVAALGAARACVQLQDRVVPVVFAGKQGPDRHGIQLRGEALQLLLHLRDQGRIVFLISHLDQSLDVLVLLREGRVVLCFILQILKLLHALLGFLGVVPVARSLHLSF